ncbi:hypothetical protein PIB30_040578 [Stylosanthes scabra]|uniref:Polyprenol reductase n=1 Tax=Stylosanthes scabra TaxID=79078 RepID=A0ABU6YGN3_9FABA|nr:hypothetical protein [Stylosanthes scabra]
MSLLSTIFPLPQPPVRVTVSSSAAAAERRSFVLNLPRNAVSRSHAYSYVATVSFLVLIFFLVPHRFYSRYQCRLGHRLIFVDQNGRTHHKGRFFDYYCWTMYNRIHVSYGWYFTFVQGFVYLFLIYLQGFTSKQTTDTCKTYVKLSAILYGFFGFTQLPCTNHVQIHKVLETASVSNLLATLLEGYVQ